MQNSLFRGRGGAISSCHTGEGRYLRPQWVPTFVGMAKRMIFEFLGQTDTLVRCASKSRSKRVAGPCFSETP